MNYCRKLQFTEDPDYKYVLGLFEGCMKKNGWDPKTPDFIWNKNRLVLEKEALKQNLMKVISKPIKKQDNEEAGEQQTKGGPDARKMEKNSNTVSYYLSLCSDLINLETGDEAHRCSWQRYCIRIEAADVRGCHESASLSGCSFRSMIVSRMALCRRG